MTTNIKQSPPNDAQRLYVATTTLLHALANLAEDAALDDLALYLDNARDELSHGPWGVPLVAVALEDTEPLDAVEGVTEPMGELLDLLTQLRAVTTDEVGLVAVATARLWVVDGIRYLDHVAARVAHDVAEARRRRVDWSWAS